MVSKKNACAHHKTVGAVNIVLTSFFYVASFNNRSRHDDPHRIIFGDHIRLLFVGRSVAHSLVNGNSD
jgi:hypothetical protein